MTAVQQSAAPHPAVRQRIDWIDTAKGLCMILVIVGHTLPCFPCCCLAAGHCCAPAGAG